MKKQTIKIVLFAIIIIANITSCKKEKPAPKPDEQELITTLKIQLGEPLSSFIQTFEYKVENGFSSGSSAGSIRIDTLKLKPSTTYDAVLTVLNEKVSPIENITDEIIEKSAEHLFLFSSNPVSGNGALSISAGNKDKNGAPLNQTFKLTTGTSGSGKFQITLLHQPNNKNATTTETAGGETDLDAVFPVVLQ